MAKRILEGMLVGVGIVIVVGVAFAIAIAEDIFTVDKDGTTKFAVSDAGKITVGATESYVNLVIQNDEVAAEADNKVDITADVLTVEGIRLENVNVSANIESLGVAGGLDTGGEDPNKWYYVWAITNNDGTQRNGLLTEAGTASEFNPVMPSGFTKKRRVGAVRNNGSGNFLQFVQEGNKIAYLDGTTNNRILTAGASLTFSTLSASTFMPPSSRRVSLRTELFVAHGTAGQGIQAFVRKTGSSALYGSMTGVKTQIANIIVTTTAFFDVDTNASNQVDYRLDVAPSDSGLYVDVFGYYDRI